MRESTTAAPGPTHLPYLDGWRGLAIGFLLVGHFYAQSWINFGAFGVELFFVLSGRLMAEILFVKKQPLPTFVRRRISRVVPAMIVMATLVFGFATLFPSVLGPIPLHDYAAGVLFATNYLDYFDVVATPIAHLWSLAVEEHSYLLLMILALLTARSARAVTVIAAALAVLMMAGAIYQAVTFGAKGHALYWRTDVRAASILLPFALHLAIRERLPKLPTIAAASIAPVAFGLSVWLMSYSFPEWARYSAGTFMLAVSVVTVGACAPAVAALSTKPLVAVGLVSFSVYLWQQPFYPLQGQMGSGAALACGAALGLVSYHLVEKPARAWLNERWGPRATRSPLPATA